MDAAAADDDLLKGHESLLEESHATKNLATFSSHDLTQTHLEADSAERVSIGGAKAHAGWLGEIATSSAKSVREKSEKKCWGIYK